MIIDYVQSFTSVVSALAAAFATYYAYRAMRENKKNIFLKDRNRLALALHRLHKEFQHEWMSFKFSEHIEAQNIILASKYIISTELYDELMVLMVQLHKFENDENRSMGTNDKAEEIDILFKKVTCKNRLDE
ncbi:MULTISPECIES: hypothetical protein [unclassified Motilimonas]|uniref:hypothetical protein n=1 Tax=unclassified Motilimonas TaxID=2643697 RepID=UPI001E31CD1D|nr:MULTISPECIES: hypothetical protein [unclassified Motilimonas]MCE0558030.1 hypothetical protein [Motilimonas sp. E26]MDO6526035.1 hypothetical protein [Motilimonas sp. 1_MG-2023]